MRRAWLVWALALPALAYLGLVGALSAFGRSFIYHPDPAVIERRPDDPAAIEDIRIATPDGETLRAWWMPPAPGKPVIVYFDGNAGRLHLQGYRFAEVEKRGYGMLAPAYRGYSGSTGRPSEAAFHADARLVHDWVRSRSPGHAIIAHGFSLGTGVAVRLAAQRPVRALVLEAPYTAIVDVAADAAPALPMRLIMKDRYLSRDWIGRVSAPVLVVHGDADQVIPFAHGERLFAKARKPKTFVRMPGGGHSDLVARGLYGHVWRFLDAPAGETGTPDG